MAFDCNGDRLPDKFLHADDKRVLDGDRLRRAKVRAYAESASNSERVYDAVVNETGYNHSQQAKPVRSAIRYNKVTGKWEGAPLVYEETVTPRSNLVKKQAHDARQGLTKRGTGNVHGGGSF